jgi:uncharacterized protein YjbJ (UPF0337 family)
LETSILNAEMSPSHQATQWKCHGTDRAMTEYFVNDERIEINLLRDTDRDNRASRREPPMNHNQVAGKWSQIKGQAKETWGELTDDDFAKAEGSVEKLYGVIQERFGDTTEAIQSKFNTFDKESRKTP